MAKDVVVWKSDRSFTCADILWVLSIKEAVADDAFVVHFGDFVERNYLNCGRKEDRGGQHFGVEIGCDELDGLIVKQR